MTIEDVIRAVAEETGRKATADSKLSDLVDDSLEFTNLLAKMADEFTEIPDGQVSKLDTVRDLYNALCAAPASATQQGRGSL